MVYLFFVWGKGDEKRGINWGKNNKAWEVDIKLALEGGTRKEVKVLRFDCRSW